MKNIDNADSWLHFGSFCQFIKKDEDMAEKMYRESLKIDKEKCRTLAHLGIILHKKGNIEEAEKCYKKVLELSGGNYNKMRLK